MRFAARGRHLLVYDLVVIGLAIVGAFALRFDANDVLAVMRPYLPVALLPLVVQPIVNISFGMYRREWRYASVREMLGIVAAVGTGSVISATIFVILAALDVPSTTGMPRSFFPLEALLSLALIGGGRFALRWALENSGRPSDPDGELVGVRTLIYGAGEAGAAVARLAARDLTMNVKVVGFLDDDAAKQGSRLLGLRIYGGLGEMREAVQSSAATQLVVAMPSAPGSVVRQAVDLGRLMGLTIKIVPNFNELLGGTDQVARIRSVSVDDLLRREPVRVDIEELADYLNGATVLITGAGGSIGGELARQILTLGPGTLVAADNNEAALWGIERELGERHAAYGPVVTARLCDIRSATAVERLVRTVRPDVVFHAAALKHVPICELQPSEAVLTNAIGTRNLLRACEDVGAGRFVLISTDKAVQPVSVLGATKRLAELQTISAGRRSGRPHLAVRFGNVLNSSGSVVPIFQHQLARGLPLTITHPDATRFFMTIPEAVSLILQAGASETSGEIFILDMGKPVRIIDLAEDMIRLSGLDPSTVDIVYTGLRPGERLEERLIYDHESMASTEHERVWRATTAGASTLGEPLEALLDDLEAAAMVMDDAAIRERLRQTGVLAAPGMTEQGVRALG
ncbi:MAG TPA: nucleoside-diphosphate sugar epimerase/dehydratase [Candidatus Limnocylindrales bacterium]|nr:nucleoside-diphosphate sugar epimerase/dehydratase [Candidatus Limnocylindrales bacterium]